MSKITFTSLDHNAPYGLGNKEYELTFPVVCGKCRTEVTENTVGILSGWNDGYKWDHPTCPKCFDFLPAQENESIQELEASELAAMRVNAMLGGMKL